MAFGGGAFGNVSAEGGDTNVIVKFGQRQSFGGSPNAAAHKLKGTVKDADGKPVSGALVAVFPSSGDSLWRKTATNGAFNLTWSLQPWQMQSGGGALLVARDPLRNVAATEELSEDVTNMDVKMKPALTLTGLVLKAGNSFDSLNEQGTTTDATGRYEIKCLPMDAHYIVFASTSGFGKSQQQVSDDSETNCMELSPLVLKRADRVLAGRVLNDNDKPVSGIQVNLNGDGQPDGNMTTDSQGRFHFQVCEGPIRLSAFSPQGGGFAQASAQGGRHQCRDELEFPAERWPPDTASRAAQKQSAS
jgi:hypothetical protein